MQNEVESYTTDAENQSIEVTVSKLFPCPDCGGMISKRALTCPKCGAPIEENAEKHGSVDISAEKHIDTYRPSALSYLWSIILGFITIPIGLGIFVLIYIFIEIKFTTYELTNCRIIVRRGWIAKEHNEIWIKDMRGVNLVQSIWQRIINVGNISIGTAASCGSEISITGIADPAEVVSQINTLRHT